MGDESDLLIPTLVTEKTFTSVEPFVLSFDNDCDGGDDDDDDDKREVETPLSLCKPQMDSEASSSVLPETVDEESIMAADLVSVACQLAATDTKVQAKTNGTVGGLQHMPVSHKWTARHELIDCGKHGLHIE